MAMKLVKTVKFDQLGRLTIPINFFRALDFSEKQLVEISIQFGTLCIEKFGQKSVQEKPFTGIVRSLDLFHRAIIPSEFRTLLNLYPKETSFLK